MIHNGGNFWVKVFRLCRLEGHEIGIIPAEKICTITKTDQDQVKNTITTEIMSCMTSRHP